ncbi:MAG: hypothetical protein M3138_05765, partial [Actinomycetota bacterium]|nr:hypothetical protein [Actinomycetota bacterium]
GRLGSDTITPLTPADGLADPVVETVEPVVDDVLGLVDDPPGGGQVDPPDLGGGGGSHVTGSPAAEERRETPSQAPGSGGVAGKRPLDGPGLPLEPQTAISAASGAAPERPSSEGFGAALRGAARSLAIVLALFGLAVAFVALQDRLDRSDPRLALAPVESDVVEFA